MPTEGNEKVVMANKCLELCQALASQGQKFSFSLSIGTDFSFSLDTKEKSTSLDNSKMTTLQQGRKKLSPSQVRRNQQRKDDFLKRKFDTSQTVLSEQKKHWSTFLDLGPLNIFGIPWTFKYIFCTLDLLLSFANLGPLATFWIPSTFMYLLNTLDFRVPFAKDSWYRHGHMDS